MLYPVKREMGIYQRIRCVLDDLAIMVKALVTVEGTARLIYPELDFVSTAKNYVSRL
jgi:ubiquinone biosynthesis protein